MGIQHNVSARPLIDIYPGSHRRMKLSINGYQMIFSKTFPSMTNDLPHLWSVLIAQLKAWISKASYNIPLNCQWSIASAVAACTSAKLLFFQTQFCIITAYHMYIYHIKYPQSWGVRECQSIQLILLFPHDKDPSKCLQQMQVGQVLRCPHCSTWQDNCVPAACSTAAPQHINSSLSPVRGEDISLHSLTKDINIF